MIAAKMVIDVRAHTVTLCDQKLRLPPRTFELLAFLHSRAGEVVPVNTLMTEVWGQDFTGEPQALYVHIRWLREKLEADPNHPRRILTVHGAGYKLVPQES
jgi:DNA-binding response OmpR family regulator